MKGTNGFTFSLLKLREEEQDGNDGDAAGVTVSFVNFNVNDLLDSEGTKIVDALTRVVQTPNADADGNLTNYFHEPKSEGGYVIADRYVEELLKKNPSGIFKTSAMDALVKEIARLEKALSDHDNAKGHPYAMGISPETIRQSYTSQIAKLRRVLDALISINKEAKREIFNPTTGTVTIKDVSKPDDYDRRALLAMHSGDVNSNSFVAEIKFHADYAHTPSLKEHAIRSDMALGEGNFTEDIVPSIAAPFHNLESSIVKEQEQYHGKR